MHDTALMVITGLIAITAVAVTAVGIYTITH